MRCNVSKHMYCVSGSRAAGRILTPVILFSAVSLLGACSSDIARFNYPVFGFADNNNTSSLPVPSAPVYRNQGRSSAPAPDYSNRPVPLNRNRRYGQNNGQVQFGNQHLHSSNQGYGSNRQYGGGLGNNVSRSAHNSTGNNSGHTNYGQQNRVKVARLPEPIHSHGPLPTRGSIPQVTFKAPSTSATAAPGVDRIVEVAQGQTLYGIAKAYGVSVDDIKAANNIQGNSLEFGQKLIIPAPGGNQQTAYLAPSKRVANRNVRSVRTVPVMPDRGAATSYRVIRGDSLYAIARRHGMTSAELARYNGISQSAMLKPGQTLSVPKTGAGNSKAARAPARVARRSDTGPAAARLPRPLSRSIAKFRWPVEGRIISRFGAKNNGTHNDGVNLAVPAGTSVRSAENGVVAYAGNELKGYGNLILIRHADDWVSAYAHVDRMLVRRGDKISRGQVIAKSGRTGNVDRPQVHFELRKNSKPVNPLTHLASR